MILALVQLGVESSYNDILSGTDGLIEGQKDGQNNFLQDTTNTIQETSRW